MAKNLFRETAEKNALKAYICRITAGDQVYNDKLILIK